MTTAIEKLLSRTEEGRLELARQELLVSVSDQLWGVLEQEKLNCAELAQRLKTSASNVSQMLSGKRNLTLSTLAEIAFVLGHQARVHLRKNGVGANVLPMKWKLYGREIKTLDVPASRSPTETLSFETASHSFTANKLIANASKSAAT